MFSWFVRRGVTTIITGGFGLKDVAKVCNTENVGIYVLVSYTVLRQPFLVRLSEFMVAPPRHDTRDEE